MALTSVNKPTGIKNLLRALRSRNYRLFVAGQSVSLVGTWMQQVAMSWLVYLKALQTFIENENVVIKPEDVQLATYNLARGIRTSQ